MKGAGDHDLTRLYDGAKGPRTEGVTLALVNPAAAGGRAALLWQRLEPLVRRGFPGLMVRLTSAAGDAERIASEWGGDNPTGSLLVAGGDGTLHESVNGLVRSASRAALGVLPAGSGNDFARNLDIPLDPFEAAQRLQQDSTRRVDLGQLCFQADGVPHRRIFLNSVSLGVSVRANRLARRLGRVRPGRLRYVIGGLAAVLSGRNASYRVSSGDRLLHDGPVLNLTVANGACFGGGMRISPGSVPADGTLELVNLAAMGRLRALYALARLQRGTPLALRELSVTPVTELRIAGAAGSLRMEADGEELEVAGELRVEILPGRLALLS
jgi:diacylglycerol kinase (ATP)